MPVNPVVADVAEFRVHFNIDGTEEAINVLNVAVDVPWTLTNLESVAVTIQDAYSTELQAFWSDRVVQDEIVATSLAATDAPRYHLESPIAGLINSAPLPYQTAACVSWKTATRGKSGRGRTFLAGFTEVNSDGANPDTALIAAIDSWATTLRTSLAGADAGLCVVSRYEPNPTPPPSSIPRADNIYNLVTAHRTDRVWKTQRRRAL